MCVESDLPMILFNCNFVTEAEKVNDGISAAA